MNFYNKVWRPTFDPRGAQGATTPSISTIEHPAYAAADYEKYRLTFEGGTRFMDRYLKQLSKREDADDFAERKAISYVPAFAKSAIVDIKNAIFNRMTDVRRVNGDITYQQAVNGAYNGVDNDGSSMNSFIGSAVLPELLPIGRVGIFVDRVPGAAKTKADDQLNHPYLYTYVAEQIRSWTRDNLNRLVAVLLEAEVPTYDEEYGLVNGTSTEYRLLRLVEPENESPYVLADTFSSGNNHLGQERIDIPMIPLVVLDLTHSLLADVADYQIAHLNLASGDMSYGVKGNFPFYTEQYDPLTTNRMRTTDQIAEGTTSDAATAKGKEVTVGAVHGRMYSQGVDRPDFIAPPAEPMRVSMEKQDVLKKEIRQLVNLAVANMDPGRESAESKKIDSAGLDAGLSYIGLQLEKAENQIATIWAAYMGGSPATVHYPEDYSLQSTQERLTRATELRDLIKSSPSKTYQREMTKLMSEILLGNKLDGEEMRKIYTEIDAATIVYVDPDVLHKDVEFGIASAGTVSIIRGYSEGEAEIAKQDKAERAALIVAAQTKAAADNQAIVDGGARGASDLDPTGDSARQEKKESQNRDTNVDLSDGKRGAE